MQYFGLFFHTFAGYVTVYTCVYAGRHLLTAKIIFHHGKNISAAR